MQLTGPEHAAMAEHLLLSNTRRYKSVSDRILAAGVHAQLAQVALLATMLTENEGEEDHDVRVAEWSASLPVPEMTEGADEVLSEWAGNPEG